MKSIGIRNNLIIQTGTYQFFASIGSKSFAMQTNAPIPIFIFVCESSPNFSGSVTGSNTLKCLMAYLPGEADLAAEKILHFFQDDN